MLQCGAATVMTTEPIWTDRFSPLWKLPPIQLFEEFSRGRIEFKIALATIRGLLSNPDGSGRVTGLAIAFMDIEKRIRQFILQNLYYGDEGSLGDDDSFLETGVVDSMGVMEIVTFLQSEFGVHTAHEELVVENFDSIRKLGQFVRCKVSLPTAAPATIPLRGEPKDALQSKAG